MARSLEWSISSLGYIFMGRNDYDKNDVANFRNQVRNILVPLASEIHDKRRQNLGLDKLSFIDEPVFFREGNPAPQGSPEEIFENGKKCTLNYHPKQKNFLSL